MQNITILDRSTWPPKVTRFGPQAESIIKITKIVVTENLM